MALDAHRLARVRHSAAATAVARRAGAAPRLSCPALYPAARKMLDKLVRVVLVTSEVEVAQRLEVEAPGVRGVGRVFAGTASLPSSSFLV